MTSKMSIVRLFFTVCLYSLPRAAARPSSAGAQGRRAKLSDNEVWRPPPSRALAREPPPSAGVETLALLLPRRLSRHAPRVAARPATSLAQSALGQEGVEEEFEELRRHAGRVAVGAQVLAHHVRQPAPLPEGRAEGGRRLGPAPELPRVGQPVAGREEEQVVKRRRAFSESLPIDHAQRVAFDQQVARPEVALPTRERHALALQLEREFRYAGRPLALGLRPGAQPPVLPQRPGDELAQRLVPEPGLARRRRLLELYEPAAREAEVLAGASPREQVVAHLEIHRTPAQIRFREDRHAVVVEERERLRHRGCQLGAEPLPQRTHHAELVFERLAMLRVGTGLQNRARHLRPAAEDEEHPLTSLGVLVVVERDDGGLPVEGDPRPAQALLQPARHGKILDPEGGRAPRGGAGTPSKFLGRDRPEEWQR